MKQRDRKCLLCNSQAFSRNLCKLCYAHQRRAEKLDRFPRVMTPVSLETRVQKTPTCWLWTGDRNDYGYGIVTLEDRPEKRVRIRAHRWVYEQLVGPIPAGKIVMHTCDNPPCVNPAHLRIGTIADNNADTGRKFRHHYGLDHWNGRITHEQIAEIRASKETQAALARKYGVHQSHISRIKRGEARRIPTLSS